MKDYPYSLCGNVIQWNSETQSQYQLLFIYRKKFRYLNFNTFVFNYCRIWKWKMKFR